MSARKATRGELVKAIRELQGLVGQIGAVYGNDRQPDRAGRMQELCETAFSVAVKAIAGDPPERPKKATP